MNFVDEATITVRSGNGGSGCVSFRREKFIPKGGPDGGDGGKGGDVILKIAHRKRTLHHFQHQKTFQAENGKGGQGKRKTGRHGKDVVVEIPPGTIVRDAQTRKIIKDFKLDDDSVIIARGGRGGQGNTRFKSSTNRTPRFAQPGEPGETLTLHLELKLLADVGLIGLPNAGKSTLIGVMSSARPKTGPYPFTTLHPNLGVVAGNHEPFVVADIPGLVQGAHQGAGLGIQFLKHVERTRVLVHLIDISLLKDRENPLHDYDAVRHELDCYNKELAKKEQVLVLNKLDLPEADANARRFRKAFQQREGFEEIYEISAVTGSGVNLLVNRLVTLLGKNDES